MNYGMALFGGGSNGRALVWKTSSRSRGSPPSFIIPKKTEKLPNKYRTPYK
jgi:hypothetical protein